MVERIVYLDAGPIVSIVYEEDMFNKATKAAMAAVSGRMVTSYISILEALVVLRRVNTTDLGGPPGESMTDHLWNAVLNAVADVEIEVKSIRDLDLLDNAVASEVLTIIGARKPTISIVGGIAPIHTSGALLPQCNCNRIVDAVRLLFSSDAADGQGEVAAQ